MKICKTCRQEKDESQFYKCGTSKSGYRASCKLCRHQVQKKSDEKNKDKRLETERIWYHKNRDRLNAKSKAWKEKNRDKVLKNARCYAKRRYYSNHEREMQRARDWKKNNPEVYAESNRASCQKRYEANKEQHLEQNKKWRENNPERVKELARKHAATSRKKFPEKARARMLVRMAIKIGTLTRPENCSACDKECKPEGHHPDYSKPLEVIWLCRKCHTDEHRLTMA